ncbi:hypothetical protein [Micromonospora rubida]
MADQQVTQPDGSIVYYDESGHAIRQVWPDGRVTTYEYRDGEQYVGTTGDLHVLYGKDDKPIKQWQGDDEASASTYSWLPDSGFSLTDPDGTVTEFTKDGDRVRLTSPDGVVTTYEYREGGQYVGTTGDSHVLYGKEGLPLKVWQGDGEASASVYSWSPDKSFSLTSADGTVTEFTEDGDRVRQIAPDGVVTTYEYREGGQYVGTTGDSHVLYGEDNKPIKVWQGDDEASGSTYSWLPDNGFSLTDPDGTVTEYTEDGDRVRQIAPDGVVTTYEYREGGQYVGTTGDMHVLYGKDGLPVKVWQGDGEASASVYSWSPDKSFSLTAADGTVTEYTKDGDRVRLTSPDGVVTTYEYREGGQYVGTTGDLHVLYGKDDKPIKVWEGDGEASAAYYKYLPNGGYQLDGPDDVVEYSADDRLVSRTMKADGTVTTYAYRDDDSYVGTTGDTHVLFGKDGVPIKVWEGDDESTASTYKALDGGHYTLTDPDGVVTEFDETDRPIRIEEPGEQPQTIEWLPDGSNIRTQGDDHSKYDANGVLVQMWTGNDPSIGTRFHYPPGGGVITEGPSGTTSYGADGKPVVTITPEGEQITWKVDLPALNEAANSVQKAKDLIEMRLQTVQRNFENIQSMWMSPAGNTFSLLAGNFRKASDVLDEALDEAVQRMRSSYQNYLASEAQNAANIAEIAKAGHK